MSWLKTLSITQDARPLPLHHMEPAILEAPTGIGLTMKTA